MLRNRDKGAWRRRVGMGGCTVEVTGEKRVLLTWYYPTPRFFFRFCGVRL